MEETAVRAPHNLMLENRTRLCLTGVKDVDSFDETAVVAVTELGNLTISGENLKLIGLNTETGELQMEGTVNALVYLESPQKGGGFFARVFR